jgi:hypothetical protein
MPREIVTADLRHRLYHLPAKEDDVLDAAVRPDNKKRRG